MAPRRACREGKVEMGRVGGCVADWLWLNFWDCVLVNGFLYGRSFNGRLGDKEGNKKVMAASPFATHLAALKFDWNLLNLHKKQLDKRSKVIHRDTFAGLNTLF